MATTLTISILNDPDKFEHAQRVGRMIGISPLFPEHLRKGGADVAMANAVLVQDMAARLNRPPMEVAQNIYFVSGKPGWSTSYLIGLANVSGGLEKKINWEITGKGDDLVVRAFATLVGGDKVEYSVSMAMAKAEGWTKNPKYKSLPELILRYRAATALIRLYMPEVTMGIPAQEEVLDPDGMRDVTPQTRSTSKAPAKAEDLVADNIVEAEVVPEDEKKPAPKKADPKKPAAKPKADEKPAVKPEPEKEVETEAEDLGHDPDTGEVNESPEPEPDTQEAADAPSDEDTTRHEQLKDMILSEIGACEDADMLDEVLGMYADQIEQLSGFSADMGDDVEEAAGKRKADLKAE
jgi:hypothetical protein